MKQMVSFAAGAVIAGTVVWSRVTGRERVVRDVEYGRGYDDGTALFLDDTAMEHLGNPDSVTVAVTAVAGAA